MCADAGGCVLWSVYSYVLWRTQRSCAAEYVYMCVCMCVCVNIGIFRCGGVSVTTNPSSLNEYVTNREGIYLFLYILELVVVYISGTHPHCSSMDGGR